MQQHARMPYKIFGEVVVNSKETAKKIYYWNQQLSQFHQRKDFYLHNNTKTFPKGWLYKWVISKTAEETNTPNLAFPATTPTPPKRTNNSALGLFFPLFLF